MVFFAATADAAPQLNQTAIVSFLSTLIKNILIITLVLNSIFCVNNSKDNHNNYVIIIITL
jgi:hypothetical protein